MKLFNVTEIGSKYRNLFAPGSLRKVFIEVQQMQFFAAAHDDMDQQLVYT